MIDDEKLAEWKRVATIENNAIRREIIAGRLWLAYQVLSGHLGTGKFRSWEEQKALGSPEQTTACLGQADAFINSGVVVRALVGDGR